MNVQQSRYPGLRLILAHKPGTPLRIIAPLTEIESQALRAYHVEGKRSATIDALLRHCWQSRYWICCGCRGDIAVPPTVYVRRALSGLVLSPMTDRTAHEVSCVFAHRSADDEVPHPPLLELLLRWMDSARLHVVYPYDLKSLVHSQYESLRDVSRSLEWPRGQQLYEHSRSHPDGLPELIRRQLLHGVRSRGNQAAFYFCVVSGLTPDHLRPALAPPDKPLPAPLVGWETQTIAQLPLAQNAKGPFAVLCEMGCESNGCAVPIRAMAAVPLYSKRLLVPLENDVERVALARLLDLQRHLLRAREIIITIRKATPGSSISLRGISFQVARIGSNGRTMRSIDVLCPQVATLSSGETDSARNQSELWSPILHPNCCHGDMLYFLPAANSDFAADSYQGFDAGVLQTLDPSPIEDPLQRSEAPVQRTSR